MVLIKYVLIVIAIIAGKKCSSFIITPPNPIYFTPPEPIVLNWTFTNPHHYRVEFYEYLQQWATWDLIFKSLVWLNANNYYNYAERLKFTTEPQCTIKYTLTKREDAGRKKLLLYSYNADGSYTSQEAFTEFIVREGQTTSSKIQPSTYSVHSELTTVHSSSNSEINKSTVYSTHTAPKYTSTSFRDQASLIPSDISPKESLYSTYELTSMPFLQPGTFSTENSEKITSTYEVRISSELATPSTMASSAVYYSSHLQKSSSISVVDMPNKSSALHASNEGTSNPPHGYSNTELSSLSTKSSIVDSMLATSTFVVYYTSNISPKSPSILSTTDSMVTKSSTVAIESRNSTSKRYSIHFNTISNYVEPNSASKHNMIYSPSSALEYTFNDSNLTLFTSKVANRTIVPGKISSTAVARTTHVIPSSVAQQSSVIPPNATSNYVLTTSHIQLNATGAGSTAKSIASWKLALSVSIPATVMVILIVAVFLYATKYKKITKILPKKEDGISEHGSSVQGRKYTVHEK